MVDHSDTLVAYRTYPHVDMAETGARAAALLDAMLASGDKPAKAREAIDFLVPITAQCTSIEPGRQLYARLAEHERAHDAALSLTMGFPAADFHDCGPSVVGYGRDHARVARAVRAVADDMNAAEGAFQAELLSPRDAVARAMARGTPGRPVILADTQDNPGAGGNGDTVGLLEALLDHPAREAALGLLVDREAARQAHDLGIGAEAEFALGARYGVSPRQKLRARLRVEALGDGAFACTGPVYQGNHMKLGPMAALRQGGVTVVVASEKVQAADQDMFRHVGIEPSRMRVLALKSSVHFRAHFEPIAEEVVVVAAAGPNPADPAELPWTKLRPGIRLRPRGPRWLPPSRSPHR
jgi:microcystin degradation protein MlrC